MPDSPSQLAARRAHHRRLGQPVLEALELRVHGQKLVQCRGAGARHAGDHQRTLNRVRKTIGPMAPALLCAQPRSQRPEHHPVGELAAGLGELRITIQRGQQPLEPAAIIRSAEVVEPRLHRGSAVQFFFQLHERRSHN